MTDAQETAITQIREIVREHFEASAVVLMGTAVGTSKDGKPNEDIASDHQYMFHGGYATCVGLAHMMERHIRKRGADLSNHEPPT